MCRLRLWIILLPALLSGIFIPSCAYAQETEGKIKEIYNHKFRGGNDSWSPMAIMQKNSESWRLKADWKNNPSDPALSGIVFPMSTAQEGDFLFVYKLFGGLQPSSLYKLSFLSSYTLQGDRRASVPNGRSGSAHLKMGANDLRPKTLNNRGNFSKGNGPKSGRNLAYLGDLHWDTQEQSDASQRYFQQNYDEPVFAITNKDGNLYVLIGMEKAAGSGFLPDIYLNTLRITFEYVGKDSLEMKRDFRVETTETEKKNVYAYEVHPIQEVVRYSIYTKDGHLIMVEDDKDCVPSCPNTIDVSFLEPDQYWVEFVLLNEKRIVQPLLVHP